MLLCDMEYIFSETSADLWFFFSVVGVLAGLVKGIVGFAMPTILISGLTFYLTPEAALAGLIVPTLIANMLQGLAGGLSAAYSSFLRFKIFIFSGAISLVFCAQLIPYFSSILLLGVLGVIIVFFSFFQILGIRFKLRRENIFAAAFWGGSSGIIGSMSGVWGPTTVAYLSALNTEKMEQIRVQGVVYSLGAILLFFSHIGSGILNFTNYSLSLILIFPTLLGLFLGSQIREKINQKQFQNFTLLVLFLAGCNMIRRAWFI